MKNPILFLALPLILALVGIVVLGSDEGVVRREVVTVIDRRPKDVFPWLYRPNRVKKWRRELVSSTAPEEGLPRTGAGWTERIRRDGKKVELEIHVNEVTVNKRLGLTITEPGQVSHVAFVLQPEGRTTRLLYVSETTYEGFLDRVLARFSSVSEEVALDESLSRLAVTLESEM